MTISYLDLRACITTTRQWHPRFTTWYCTVLVALKMIIRVDNVYMFLSQIIDKWMISYIPMQKMPQVFVQTSNSQLVQVAKHLYGVQEQTLKTMRHMYDHHQHQNQANNGTSEAVCSLERVHCT